jgi:hypothetical protein
MAQKNAIISKHLHSKEAVKKMKVQYSPLKAVTKII